MEREKCTQLMLNLITERNLNIHPFYNLEDALWMVDEQVSSGAFKRVVVLDGRNCVSSTVR